MKDYQDGTEPWTRRGTAIFCGKFCIARLSSGCELLGRVICKSPEMLRVMKELVTDLNSEFGAVSEEEIAADPTLQAKWKLSSKAEKLINYIERKPQCRKLSGQPNA